MLGSFVGGCDLGFPSFKLLSPDPESVCWNPLHAIWGKGSYLSVGQDLYFLGHGTVLPFHRCMLGVPVRVPFALALLRGVSFLPQPSQPTSMRAAPGAGSPEVVRSMRRMGACESLVGSWVRGGWADDVPSFGARVGPLTTLLSPPLLYLAATGNLMSFPLSAGRAYSVGW